MFSDTPGTPGRSAHTPRTMRSILTPAQRGAVQRLDRLRLDQRVHLGDDARRAPGARVLGLARDLGEHHLVHAEGRLHQAVKLRGLREAGELQEQLVHVMADLVVAGEQPVVGVQARGARMVVAGAQVAVAADAAGLAAHDQRELGVGLVAHHPVHDVGAGFLQAVGQLDVRFLVEARPQLDDDRHVLAGIGRRDQRIHQRANHGRRGTGSA